MNLNKGCIEIRDIWFRIVLEHSMNLNKGCIEIFKTSIDEPRRIDEP